eukprot:gene24193-30511_t
MTACSCHRPSTSRPDLRIHILQSLTIKEFKDKEYIIRQGDVGEECCIIQEGSVKVVETRDGEDRFLREGHRFGETNGGLDRDHVFRGALSGQTFDAFMSEQVTKKQVIRRIRENSIVSSDAVSLEDNPLSSNGRARALISHGNSMKEVNEDNTLSVKKEVKVSDFNAYMDEKKVIDAKVVRAGGYQPKGEWWVWYNTTVHCVKKITGCDLGDIMCAERHAYQRLVRGPFKASLTDSEEKRIHGVPAQFKHAILTLPHQYAPRYALSLANNVYAWRKGSTTMVSTFVHSAQKVSGTTERTDNQKGTGIGTRGYQLIKDRRGNARFDLFWCYTFIEDYQI